MLVVDIGIEKEGRKEEEGKKRKTGLEGEEEIARSEGGKEKERWKAFLFPLLLRLLRRHPLTAFSNLSSSRYRPTTIVGLTAEQL